jgi:predicted nucleotidyltransferase
LILVKIWDSIQRNEVPFNLGITGYRDMKSALEAQIEAIGERYGIVALYAFGSRASEVAGLIHGQLGIREHPSADLDIGVQPKAGKRMNAQEKVRLANELEDLFEVSRVDLVILPEADPFLALDIIRGELLYCADDDLQAEYELYVLRRAGDLAHYARERWNMILGLADP